MENLNGPDLFGLNEKQLMKLLSEEIKKTKKLAEEATIELHKWSNQYRILSIKAPKPKIDKEGFDIRSKLMAAIEAERRKQQQIRTTIAKIKTGNFSYNQIIDFDFVQDTSNIGARRGEDAHDKYARVMENLTDAADIRETWDSSDVIKIDDVAIEKNISYEQAKEIIEKQSNEGTPASDVLGEDGDDEI